MPTNYHGTEEPKNGILDLDIEFGLGAKKTSEYDKIEKPAEKSPEIEDEATKMIRESGERARKAMRKCEYIMSRLAALKLIILQGDITQFVLAFSKIKVVNFKGLDGFDALVRFFQLELSKVRRISNDSRKVTIREMFSNSSGMMLAVDTAHFLAAETSTGENARKAERGSAGDIVELIEMPKFTGIGMFTAQEAAKDPDKAQMNMKMALAYQEECRKYICVMDEIEEHCWLYFHALYNMENMWYRNLVKLLQHLVDGKKFTNDIVKNVTGQKTYTPNDMELVSNAAIMTKQMRGLLETILVDSNGNITSDSKDVIMRLQKDMGPDICKPTDASCRAAETMEYDINHGDELFKEEKRENKEAQAAKTLDFDPLKEKISFARGFRLPKAVIAILVLCIVVIAGYFVAKNITGANSPDELIAMAVHGVAGSMGTSRESENSEFYEDTSLTTEQYEKKYAVYSENYQGGQGVTALEAEHLQIEYFYQYFTNAKKLLVTATTIDFTGGTDDAMEYQVLFMRQDSDHKVTLYIQTGEEFADIYKLVVTETDGTYKIHKKKVTA